jgi:hypothetical protein
LGNCKWCVHPWPGDMEIQEPFLANEPVFAHVSHRHTNWLRRILNSRRGFLMKPPART